MTDWTRLTVTRRGYRPGRCWRDDYDAPQRCDPDKVAVTLHRTGAGDRDNDPPVLVMLVDGETARLPMYELGATWVVHPDDCGAPESEPHPHCNTCRGNGHPCADCGWQIPE